MRSETCAHAARELATATRGKGCRAVVVVPWWKRSAAVRMLARAKGRVVVARVGRREERLDRNGKG